MQLKRILQFVLPICVAENITLTIGFLTKSDDTKSVQNIFSSLLTHESKMYVKKTNVKMKFEFETKQEFSTAIESLQYLTSDEQLTALLNAPSSKLRWHPNKENGLKPMHVILCVLLSLGFCLTVLAKKDGNIV